MCGLSWKELFFYCSVGFGALIKTGMCKKLFVMWQLIEIVLFDFLKNAIFFFLKMYIFFINYSLQLKQ